MVSNCRNHITQQELISYLNDPDNGLKQEFLNQGIKVSVTYRPSDLIVQQNVGKEASSEEKNEYSRYNYFILSMSANDKDILYKNSESRTQFSETLNRLNFTLPEYIYGIGEGKDTVYLADFYVPNFYGMGGVTQIMLAFPNEKKYEYFEVRLKEIGLRIGEKRFLFKKKDIDNIPLLNNINNS